MKKLLYSILFVATAAILGSCSGDTEDRPSRGSGKVILQMNPGATLALAKRSGKIQSLSACPLAPPLTCVTPAEFEMKILAAYVVENVDPENQDNVGEISRVWVNPDCPEEGTCLPADVEYMSLNDPTSFNAILNSQARSIVPGTYRYVRIEFCQGSPGVDNVRAEYGGVTISKPYGGCGVTSAALSQPLVLNDGETFTINVAYDLSDGEVYQSSGGGSCDSPLFCIGGIELVPSIVVP
jgi:hypothetical protein